LRIFFYSAEAFQTLREKSWCCSGDYEEISGVFLPWMHVNLLKKTLKHN